MNIAEDKRSADGESEPFISEEEILDGSPLTPEEAAAQYELKEEWEWELQREEKERKERRLLKKAKALIAAPDFLTRVLDICQRMGVVGEENSLLTFKLSGVSRTLPRPVSTMLRGSPSSGKSSTMNAALQLFNPEIVLERAAISGKALFHGEGPLTGKILVLTEYHAGKDSRHLIRLAQTEGVLTDETTVLEGRRRSTAITERTGRPSVWTTTSEEKIAADDLSRFQVVWADESAEQSLRVMRSRASTPPKPVDTSELEVWRKATSLIVAEEKDFQHPPKWLRSLPRRMPLERVGIRRDFERFLTFLKAIALCRGCASRPEVIDIELADYAVAYLIFEPVFGGRPRTIADQDLELALVVARLNDQEKRPVTVNEIAEALGWKPALVYKTVKSAVEQNLVMHEDGTRERNVKRLVARSPEGGRFLPHPRSILRDYPKLGGSVTFTNPFTGEPTRIRAEKRGGGKIGGVAPSRCKHGVNQGLCAECAGSQQ